MSDVQHLIPSFVPASARKRLAEWHPSRARRWRRFPGIQRVAGTQAVLTFDDGPDADGTPRVLEQLAAAQVKATFFVLGEEVTRAAGVARAIVDQGHELALHGYAHRRLDRTKPEAAAQDLALGVEAVAAVTGQAPRWFRPPFGRLSEGAFNAMHELGLELAYWSVTGSDWEENDGPAVASQIASQLDSGAIVLLHDSARYGRRSSAQPTALALPAIVRDGTEKGLSWVTLSRATDDDADAHSVAASS